MFGRKGRQKSILTQANAWRLPVFSCPDSFSAVLLPGFTQEKAGHMPGENLGCCGAQPKTCPDSFLPGFPLGKTGGRRRPPAFAWVKLVRKLSGQLLGPLPDFAWVKPVRTAFTQEKPGSNVMLRYSPGDSGTFCFILDFDGSAQKCMGSQRLS